MLKTVLSIAKSHFNISYIRGLLQSTGVKNPIANGSDPAVTGQINKYDEAGGNLNPHGKQSIDGLFTLDSEESFMKNMSGLCCN